MTKLDKIQYLLISHLLEEGHIAINLPSGFVLEFGITKESKNGDLEKADDYCWIIATDRQRSISMDSYNLGLRFSDDERTIVFDDSSMDGDGQPIRILSVV